MLRWVTLPGGQGVVQANNDARYDFPASVDWVDVLVEGRFFTAKRGDTVQYAG